MITNPTNFAEQFQNFIEHIASLMKTYYSKSGGTISGNVDISGDLTANTVVSLSDKNYKKDITPISEVNLSNLGSYKYLLKTNPNKYHIGLLAQEVETLFPEAVENKNGILKLDYNAIVALLVNKVNELENRIKILEDK